MAPGARGMFGQIHWRVLDVTPQIITVEVRTRHTHLDPEREVLGIRDGILGYTRDLVPCQRFRALFTNPMLNQNIEYEFPFIEALDAGVLRSRLILNELAIGPHRDQMRPRFKQAWRRFHR